MRTERVLTASESQLRHISLAEDGSFSRELELTQSHGNTCHLVQSVEERGNLGERYHDRKVKGQNNTL